MEQVSDLYILYLVDISQLERLMEMHPSMMLPCTSYCGVLNTPTIIIILSIHLDEEDIDENVRIL